MKVGPYVPVCCDRYENPSIGAVNDLLPVKTDRVARSIIPHLAAALSLNTATIGLFSVFPLNMAMITAAMIISSAALMIDTLFFEKNDYTPEIERFVRGVCDLSIVNWFGQSSFHILAHEMGHALSALATLKGAKITLSQFSPFQGGAITISDYSGLTLLGKLLGAKGSLALIVAGGIIGTTSVAMGCVGVSQCISDWHPELARYLDLYALSSILTEFSYGFVSWLDPTIVENSDFIKLWDILGLHPLITLGCMIASPALLIRCRKQLADAGGNSGSKEHGGDFE